MCDCVLTRSHGRSGATREQVGSVVLVLVCCFFGASDSSDGRKEPRGQRKAGDEREL